MYTPPEALEPEDCPQPLPCGNVLLVLLSANDEDTDQREGEKEYCAYYRDYCEDYVCLSAA